MAKPRQSTRGPRCAYIEREQRCRRVGTGNPPLCEAHRIVLEEEAARPQRPGEKLIGLIGRALRGQKITDEHVYAGVEDFVDVFSRPPEGIHSPLDAARARAQDFFRHAQAQAQGRPSSPKPRKPSGPDPRTVLGFAAGQKITAAEVKARHRELARSCHPDKGGSTRKMAEINDAVDRLLRTL